MKKYRILRIVAIALLMTVVASCEKVFDSLEGDLTKMSESDMMSSEAGITGQLVNLYTYMPMNAFSTGDRNTMMGNSSRTTATYGVDGVSSFWNYSSIRSINRFIRNLDIAVSNGVITEEQKKSFLGEALFIRAYCYFASVRRYGGVPIVTEPLDGYYDGKDNEGLYVDRSTEKETWDWILEQLTEAAGYLPEKQSGDMRINKYSALGLKVRVALWAASESKYWGNAALDGDYVAVKKKLTYMEDSYSNEYYKQCLEAATAIISSGRFALYGAGPASVEDAVNNLTNLFQDWHPTEGLLGRSYKDGSATSGNGIESWAPFQVSITGWNSGTGSVTANLADAYDCYKSETDRTRASGILQSRNDGDESGFVDTPEETLSYEDIASFKHYDSVDEPFKLKDARFQAWICYPDCIFRGTVIKMQGGIVTPDKQVLIYPVENSSYQSGGMTYWTYGGSGEANSSFYKLSFDTNSNNRSDYCFMVRKFLDQKTMNMNTQTPWYDIRFAEILLSYAEAVVESGLGDRNLAKRYLNDIRHRAGFTDDVEPTLPNILHEWQVEFAFENMWSNVMFRRRAFYDPDQPGKAMEGMVGQKLTFIPVVDLSGDKPGYIFIRSASYFNDIKRSRTRFQVKPEAYYSAIPNYANNKIDNNNTIISAN
ncbi:MAG: RagB/SusD family nutrient uptake outer membrane protein [Bacteroidales bacterium]|nr:RagB/SusD family nutrient uptake outer membrane protein [Bacteroidales bacterium]